MVKCRLISDLHYTRGINGPDYDKTYKNSGLYHYFGKKLKEPVDVTLIAGDICEGIENHAPFFESFFPNQKVVFIEGNHEVYGKDKDGRRFILSKLKEEHRRLFPETHMFYHYLENSYEWLDYPNVAVIGSTFYTDYKYCDLTLEEVNNKAKAWHTWALLYGLKVGDFTPYEKLDLKTIRHETMSEAISRLNDFDWGNQTVYKKLTPEYYLKLHNQAKKEVKRCHDEILNVNPNAKIILMTHHCLSPRVIAEQFKGSLMNASYVSELEKWVDKELTGVKLVFSGHVHNRNDFTFGKRGVRYITNPCGYLRYNEPFKDVKFNPNLIIDTDEL